LDYTTGVGLCLYIGLEQNGEGNLSFAIIGVHVDDLILTSNANDFLEELNQELMANYKMTNLGDLSWCLGI
jgi:hypothetical protein